MSSRFLSRQRLFVSLMLLLCFFTVSFVSAQDAGPITLNENKVGQLAQPGSIVEYTLTVLAPQTVTVQVLSITPGLLPAFEVKDPSLVTVGGSATTGQDIVQGNVTLAAAGNYRIRVYSTANRAGDFLVSIQAGAPIAPPQSLTLGQPATGQLNSQTALQSYAFLGSPTEALRVTVQSTQPNSSPAVVLKDGTTNEILAVSGVRLSGARFEIPATLETVQYVLLITYSGLTPTQAFNVCLETVSGSISCPANGNVAPTAIATQFLVVPVTPTFRPVEIPPTGACQVASLQGQTINVRQGPGLEFNVVARLQPTATALVFGRTPDNSWYQVNVNGILGWVSATVVRIGGVCNSVPVVQPPTPIATFVGPTPTFTATSAFIPTATATSTLAPAPVATLNYTGSPTFGSTSLSVGFVPDPFSVGITSGGIVNASYLGGGCTGFAAVSPDYSVTYTGSASLLRFYFVGGAGSDTTMIINSPSTNFFCSDDSFSTLNPSIDFTNAPSGRYDIWIGSFSQGNNTSGTLFVTELSGNHP